MTTLTTTDSIKLLRETFCVAQVLVGQSGDPRAAEHVARLGRLIDDCDRQRPLGPDGKHGDRHTPTCGCGDPPRDCPPKSAAVPQTGGRWLHECRRPALTGTRSGQVWRCDCLRAWRVEALLGLRWWVRDYAHDDTWGMLRRMIPSEPILPPARPEGTTTGDPR